MSDASDIDPVMLQAVKDADERAAIRSTLPTGAELFPGLRDQIVEYFMFQISMMALQRPAFADCLQWWEALGERGRPFILRLARQPKELATAGWVELTLEQRARCVGAFMWLYTWTNNFHPPLSPFISIATAE